jgi:hypothetical protein
MHAQKLLKRFLVSSVHIYIYWDQNVFLNHIDALKRRKYS